LYAYAGGIFARTGEIERERELYIYIYISSLNFNKAISSRISDTSLLCLYLGLNILLSSANLTNVDKEASSSKNETIVVSNFE
jgi:hypothetical protein